eukprot:COSAG05_NODE_538_length_8854_cov_306.308738_7_plen_64_part_00
MRLLSMRTPALVTAGALLSLLALHIVRPFPPPSLYTPHFDLPYIYMRACALICECASRFCCRG